MKLACVSHQSHTKATSSRGAVASPRDYNRSHLPDYRCSSDPSPLAPAPDTFEQLQTRVERVSGARDDIVTMLGRMGKGSFDERRSMRKRIYDKEGGREGGRVVKAGDREARRTPARERRWMKEPFKNGTRHDLFDTVKRNSWESQKNISICICKMYAHRCVCNI